MIKFIDLSHNIEEDMPVHPFDTPIKLYQNKFLATDKFNNFSLQIGTHVGTHIDTPMHLTDCKKTINQYDLKQFIGRVCLLNVINQNTIKYKEHYSNQVSEGDIVLLYTNHSQKYNTPEYFSGYPVVDDSLAEFFIEKKIKMLGIDAPAPDTYPFAIHKMLFSRNILIIENLTNLAELVGYKNSEIIAFPLKIKADASPVRAVVKINTQE